jgi:nucleoside 2-deoxyribosyltransferase
MLPIKSIYIIGSLKNRCIVNIGNALRDVGIDAFDDWLSAGPEADDFWKEYADKRGLSYKEALEGHAAKHVYEFDKFHLDRCDAALLVLPAGKSGHLELGYTLGKGKPGWILLDELVDKATMRYDVMYQFADGIFETLPDFMKYITQ